MILCDFLPHRPDGYYCSFRPKPPASPKQSIFYVHHADLSSQAWSVFRALLSASLNRRRGPQLGEGQ
jgi:hypothetical protein